MKVTIILLILIFLCSCSQKHQKPSTANSIIVTGRVLNRDPLNNSVIIVPNRIAVNRESIEASLDENGYFKASFRSYIPLDFWIKYKTNFLVLAHPGDSLFVEFDGSAKNRPELLDDVKFSGDFASENQQAAEFQEMYYSNNFYPNIMKRDSLMEVYDPERFTSYLDSCRGEWDKLLARYRERYYPKEIILNWAKLTLETDYYQDLLNYLKAYSYRAEKKGLSSESIPADYLNLIKHHFKVDKSVLINGFSMFGFVDYYKIYIMEIIRHENKQFFSSRDTVLKHQDVFDSLRFFGTINNTNDSLLKQMVLTEMLYQGLEFSKVEIFDRFKKEISEIITEPYLKEPLFEEYRNTLDKINNPVLASDIIMKKISSSILTASIDSTIKSNKGKVIYLDCWATWCGPCLTELPQSLKLMKEYKGKKVSFIFVCIDSEDKNWKALLSRLQLKGEHLYLNKEGSAEFRKQFNIKGIPRYILFDKKGNIADDNAPSPSDLKIKLDKLLN
jgi:thiol-disulfide isomerase/thioredoxin